MADRCGLNVDIKHVGNTIVCRDEDPHIRKMLKERLAKEGAEFNRPRKFIAERCERAIATIYAHDMNAECLTTSVR